VLTVFSDEDTSVEAVVTRWLHNQDEDDRDVLGSWIKDYFYDALKWILEQVQHSQLLCCYSHECRGLSVMVLTVTGVRFYVRPTSFCCIIFCLLQSQLLFNLFAVVFVRVDWCLNGQPLALTFGCTAVLPPLQTIPQRWPPCWIRSGVRVSAIFEKSSITLIG